MLVREAWTTERRQFVLDEMEKGKTLVLVAKELNVPPGQLRCALRYHNQLPPPQTVRRKKDG
jgi:hypothetical protein